MEGSRGEVSLTSPKTLAAANSSQRHRMLVYKAGAERGPPRDRGVFQLRFSKTAQDHPMPTPGPDLFRGQEASSVSVVDLAAPWQVP